MNKFRKLSPTEKSTIFENLERVVSGSEFHEIRFLWQTSQTFVFETGGYYDKEFIDILNYFFQEFQVSNISYSTLTKDDLIPAFKLDIPVSVDAMGQIQSKYYFGSQPYFITSDDFDWIIYTEPNIDVTLILIKNMVSKNLHAVFTESDSIVMNGQELYEIAKDAYSNKYHRELMKVCQRMFN